VAKRKRSAAQRAATRRMLAANRKHKSHKSSHRRKRKSPVMAKKRRRRSSRRSPVTRRRRRSHGGGGGGGGGKLRLMPDRSELELMAGAGVLGWAEGEAKSKADFILNKVPRVIGALGYMGNTALALRLLAHFFPAGGGVGKYLKVAAKSASIITIYQLGHRGKAFDTASEHFTLAGDEVSGGEEHLIDDAMMGALDAEGNALDGTYYDAPIEENVSGDDGGD
jgi:hypothetical protein